MIQALFSGVHLKGRLEAVLKGGLVMHTDCSDELGPECCMHMMSQAMRERGTDILPVDRIILWRACDKSPLAKRVIANHKLCPLHVFDGMLEKLPAANQLAVKNLRAGVGASDEDRVRSFQRIDQYLHKNARALYSRDARATNCVLHPGFACPSSFQDPDSIDDAERPLTFAFAGTPCRPHTVYSGKRESCGGGPAHPDNEAFELWKHDVRCQGYDAE